MHDESKGTSTHAIACCIDAPSLDAEVVSHDCTGCASHGHAPGTPYPALAMNSDGTVRQLPGFDSHIPIYFAYEHPDFCNLVDVDATIPISQYNWGSVDRYSDTCDYVLHVTGVCVGTYP